MNIKDNTYSLNSLFDVRRLNMESSVQLNSEAYMVKSFLIINRYQVDVEIFTVG
jgi:hypothetical protein